MSETNNQPKQYVSKVLLKWETKENEGKIIFPKKNCVCRNCPHMDWKLSEIELPPDEDEDNKEQKPNELMLDLTNYCHYRYSDSWGRGLPNIIDCDGLYKQPKE